MNLHLQPDTFENAIVGASEQLGIPVSVVEKDYYVTLFLKKFVEKQPEIIFKGGTSLSKCQRIIKRFSEDIDLNMWGEEKPTAGERRKIKDKVIATIEELGFELLNPEKIGSRYDLNKYEIKYPVVNTGTYLKSEIIVETAIFFPAYPVEMLEADCYVYQYLQSIDRMDIVDKYDLHPFKLKVQSLDRTLVDKVFALCDYYLRGNLDRHSRHVYDIYKLLERVELNDDFRMLIEQVRNVRRRNVLKCPSAQEDVNVSDILKDIIDSRAFEEDYENNTKKLLYEEVSYDVAAKALSVILESGLF